MNNIPIVFNTISRSKVSLRSSCKTPLVSDKVTGSNMLFCLRKFQYFSWKTRFNDYIYEYIYIYLSNQSTIISIFQRAYKIILHFFFHIKHQNNQSIKKGLARTPKYIPWIPKLVPSSSYTEHWIPSRGTGRTVCYPTSSVTSTNRRRRENASTLCLTVTWMHCGLRTWIR